MSISGIGSALPLGGASKPPSVDPAAPADPAERARQKAAASADLQKSILDQIREKGLYAWAQEQKYKKLEEKIREEIMAQRGVDDASVAAMDTTARAAFQTSVEQEIASRIKDALQKAAEGDMKNADAQGRSPKPMIIDISI